jgi:metal transporter CNNM
MMSGLIVGYLSLDSLMLELKLVTGTENEIKNAKKIIPIIEKRHWLLVSLLIINALTMEALPIFLNFVFSEVIAVAISVSAVLIFGDILPQAFFTGPNQMKIAGSLNWIVIFLMYFTSPISYPLALMLDYCFGNHRKSR